MYKKSTPNCMLKNEKKKKKKFKDRKENELYTLHLSAS